MVEKVENKGVEFPKLTATEQEILTLLTDEFLTTKQIALRRQSTIQAVYKIIKILKKKGAFTKGLMMVEKKDGTVQPLKTNQYRIHAQQFSIHIIWKNHHYKELLQRCNQISIDGNTINLWPNSIDVYSNQSFYGDTLGHSFAKSAIYWPRLFARLEHETNCILFKPRAQNIKLVRIHIAETDNEIAKDIDNTGDKWFQVYAPEDGKLCFLIDNSFNLHEFEAVHSKTAKPDMEKVGSVFIDIRNNETYLPSDTKTMVDKLATISSNIIQSQLNSDSIFQKTNESVNWLAKNIETHAPSWFGMSKEAATIRKQVVRLNSILAQKKLSEYLC